MTSIFISHADADNEHAKRLCDDLKDLLKKDLLKDEVAFWIDDYDLKPPVSDYRAALHTALRESSAGLLVLSRNIQGRANITAEWNYILGVGNPLYIAKIDDVPFAEIDPRLSLIQWIDLVKLGWEAGVKTLAAVIGGESLPDDAVGVILRRRVTGTIDSKLTSIPISGRDDDLSKVKGLLRQGITTVIGIGGLGKSRLAAEMVVTSGDIDGAIWHVASDISRAGEVVEAVRKYLGLPDTTEPADALAGLNSRVLLVIDNAESVDAGERRNDYVNVISAARAAGAQVLLTSRVRWGETPAVTSRDHKLGGISLDAAKQAALDMCEAFGVETDITPMLDEYVKAARQHPRLIEWGLLQVREERSTLREIISEMTALKSADAQEALFEMIGKTAARMGLSEPEGDQALKALRKLNVCRGGFTRQAAAAILGLEADEDKLMGILKMLAAWSFLRIRGERREIDPLVIEGVGEDDTARAAHYDFYYALAREHDEKQAYFELDVERDNLDTAFAWAMSAEGDAEKAYWLANACTFYLQNRGRFEQRLDWATRTADALVDHPDEALKANAQISLGVAYMEYPLGERRENLTRAIRAFEAALVYYTAERAPMGYAMTQNNLGEAYRNLAEIEAREENLKRAITAYEAALVYRTAERAPMGYAMTQNNLGNAYGDLAAIEAREENLKRAITAYEAALVYWTAERAPMDYAMTQNNLGAAYRNLAEIEAREDNLKRAIQAYEAALVYRTAERAPMGYAMTRANLGSVYRDLGDMPTALACWREAEASFRQFGLIPYADRVSGWIQEYEDSADNTP